MALGSCSLAPAKDPNKILAGAYRALGGTDAVEAIITWTARAQVTGPSSEFETLIHSARDGSVRMEQSIGFLAGSHTAGGWQVDRTTGDITPIETATLAYVRGHELHATVLMAGHRSPDLAWAPNAEFQGDSAIVVSFSDPLGDSVFGYFSVRDTLPLGLRITNPDPDVVVTFSDWRLHGKVRLFTHAEFKQGDEMFLYDYVELTTNEVSDDLFLPPPPAR